MSTKSHKSPHLTVEDYITSSIIRFGGLPNYIQEKMVVDTFAIKGNLGIAHGVKMYIQNQQQRLKEVEKIVVLDIGPAIGAISAMLVLQELERVDLLTKTRVILLDVSERVIQSTQARSFEFPEMLIDRSLKNKVSSKLRTSKGVLGSAHQIPIKKDRVDICTAGFLFHHLHDDIKKAAASEIQRVTKTGGFIGVGEEWFDNYDDYVATHRDDEVPLAYESIISYRKLRRMFPQLEVFESHNPMKRGKKDNDNYYYFCGIKRDLGSTPRKLINQIAINPRPGHSAHQRSDNIHHGK